MRWFIAAARANALFGSSTPSASPVHAVPRQDTPAGSSSSAAMSKLIDDLKRILYEHWATGMGLVLTLVLSSGILIWTLAEINFGDVTPGEWLVVIVLLTVLVLVWWHRLPRARHDRIGFRCRN